MSETRWRNLLLVVRRALRQLFPVVVALVGGLWSIALQSLPLVALTALVVIGYILLKLQDETFVRAALQEAHGRKRQSELIERTFRIEELDLESRIRLKSIVKLQDEIADDIASSPVDEVAAGLTDIVQQTEGIVDRGLAMAQKRRELVRYLSRTDRQAIEARIVALQDRLAASPDAVQEHETSAALAAKQQELADYSAIQEAADRILSQLDAIETAFSGLRARLVRIKSTDIDEWTAANTELSTELGGLNTSVDTLEQSIEEALSIRGIQ